MRSRLWITLSLVFTACEGVTDPAVPDPTSSVRWIVVVPTSLSLVRGSSARLTATAHDVRAALVPDVVVAWTTDNASVVAVSDSGEVTGVGKGSAIITASGGGRSRTATVTVRLPADELTLSTPAFTLLAGNSQAVVLFAKDSTAELIQNVNPTWVSSAPEVATVSGVGMSAVVRGVSPGTATITASAEGQTVAVTVTVDIPAVIGGVWDFVERLADTTGGTFVCDNTGSVAITQNGAGVNGLWDQVGRCGDEEFGGGDDRIGAVLNGTTGINSVTFTVADDNFDGTRRCLYDGAVNVERTVISGTVRCNHLTGLRGTWQATRALPITGAHLRTYPEVDSVLRGESRTVYADLWNSAGHRAFRRALIWSTSNSQVATITPDASSQWARLDAAGEGSASISVTFESATASLPVTVRTFTLTGVVAGAQISCGPDPTGMLYCWGVIPHQQFNASRLASLTIGIGQGCGLDADGAAYCWADWGTDPIESPDARVPTALRFTKISTGGWVSGYYYYYYDYGNSYHPHTCATTADGTAYCWGVDSNGQLGDGRYGSPVPTPLAALTDIRFSSIAAGGAHTCAISLAGRAYCWGANSYGQLGDGTTAQSLVPVEVAGSIDFASIHAGTNHTCALTSAGAAWCWGSNSLGAVGVPGSGARIAPVEVSGGRIFSSLALGADHTCGLTTGGDVYCWGSNYAGQLGASLSSASTSTPTQMLGNLKFTTISSSAGAYHSCGYATDQRVYCWGNSSQIGDGVTGVAGPRMVLGQR